ncbi:MAG TPA: hypothetical protein VES88_04350 [Gemmatimonadaceae bacterium]|nr:hypothetical protein [Gemmatimonadaceae bacterium]
MTASWFAPWLGLRDDPCRLQQGDDRAARERCVYNVRLIEHAD